jgi:hypothetical protein
VRIRALVAAVLVACAAPGALAQGTIDSRPLVGYWAGRWKANSGSSDNLYLDVRTADGESVRGTVLIAVSNPGIGYYNRDVPFSGVFDGNELRIWIPPAVGLTLRLAGGRLLGSLQGQQTHGSVELDRTR